jgi:hypothetical protein
MIYMSAIVILLLCLTLLTLLSVLLVVTKYQEWLLRLKRK